MTADTVLQRIAWLSARDASKCFDTVMHLFTQEALAECFHALDGRKAVGADGMTKAEYGANLERNLTDLVQRMKRMGYRPGPVREVRIPKLGAPGATRALGISSVEDKVVQGMVRKVLEAVYEPVFLDSSFGFRPGRGPHDAVRALHQYLYRHEVECVIDVDLARYFDSIDRDRLLKMVSQKVSDRRFLRYLSRLFKAGVLRDGELRLNTEGVVQGSACSPVLANIYAHYVLDEWFEATVKRHCRGEVAIFRYADDVIICCQYQYDAERIRKALSGRLAKFGLALNEAKTRMVPFRRPACQSRGRRAVFDFLGFTFYWGVSRRGKPLVKVKTSGKRLRSKLQAIFQWTKQARSQCTLQQFWAIVCAKVRGHIRYYGVSFNVRAVMTFVHRVRRVAFHWLNRRSQKRSFTWETYEHFIGAHPLPSPAVHHRLF
jgi:RNA-directed DNA polymerase